MSVHLTLKSMQQKFYANVLYCLNTKNLHESSFYKSSKMSEMNSTAENGWYQFPKLYISIASNRDSSSNAVQTLFPVKILSSWTWCKTNECTTSYYNTHQTMLISAVTELNWDKKNRITKPTILCVCIYIIYMYLLDVMSLVILTYLLSCFCLTLLTCE